MSESNRTNNTPFNKCNDHTTNGSVEAITPCDSSNLPLHGSVDATSTASHPEPRQPRRRSNQQTRQEDDRDQRRRLQNNEAQRRRRALDVVNRRHVQEFREFTKRVCSYLARQRESGNLDLDGVALETTANELLNRTRPLSQRNSAANIRPMASANTTSYQRVPADVEFLHYIANLGHNDFDSGPAEPTEAGSTFNDQDLEELRAQDPVLSSYLDFQNWTRSFEPDLSTAGFQFREGNQ
ncbi:hypothetical protein K470DRAFT_258708 [Piedraia hortae CBS 480.64]|uniref:Uncharacterized protein n=1 Tax=Piedraia hortae CBS 480.64 TaxID=1314780 RepID=A0A6A7BYT8_9PEZI|nr:hypothetical protein K470DRAFT_258708 [Piedraia hortae CBS 480.64]